MNEFRALSGEIISTGNKKCDNYDISTCIPTNYCYLYRLRFTTNDNTNKTIRGILRQTGTMTGANRTEASEGTSVFLSLVAVSCVEASIRM